MKHRLMNRLAPLALVAGLLISISPALGQKNAPAAPPTPVAPAAPPAPATPAQSPATPIGGGTLLSELSDKEWAAAKAGDFDRLLTSVATPGADDPTLSLLRADIEALRTSIQKRESMRAARVAKAGADLDEQLAATPTPASISDALKHSIELHELAPDAAAKAAVLGSARVQSAIKLGEEAARRMETEGQWLMAGELFSRLNVLLDVDGRFKADTRRIGDRLAMLRLYAPKRLWELRNERREIERKRDPKLAALPPFNSVGEAYQTKLRDLKENLLINAMAFAADRHVERIGMRKMILGGLEAIKTMVTTPDLRVAFPGLDSARDREMMLSWVNTKIKDVTDAQGVPDRFALADVINDMFSANRASTKILEAALVHEFGIGAFDTLDEFSAIIWPDELARFKRMTEASFPGVGIQIQLDEETQMIKVVTPIPGSPAQSAGVMPGDYIKKINEDSALGMSLDQAIEQITGRPGTKVKITMEREGQDVAFELTRATIPVYSVKGWSREGKGDNEWNYTIDPQTGIGYIRVTGFSDTTTRDLHRAIAKLKKTALNGLIIDLRFNPGGLLTEAVSISNTFVDSGEIVYTELNTGERVETHVAEAARVRLTGVPIIVLINEGSASASEIVSGALRHYADASKLKLLVLGNRSFGKGSVQNVVTLANTAAVKVTTQYYYLPNGKLIHRREKATSWGVDPHLKVDMLPGQISDALMLRNDADLPANAKPVARRVTRDEEDTMYRADPKNFPPNPNQLLTDGIDLQLQTAVTLLRSQILSKQPALAGGGAGVKDKTPG
jgi:carboxyl-terminal processing protease